MSRVLKQLDTQSTDSSETAVPQAFPQPYLVKSGVEKKSGFSKTFTGIALISISTIAFFFFHTYRKAHPISQATSQTASQTASKTTNGLAPADSVFDQARENDEAIQAYYAGKYDDAFEHFLKLFKKNPNSVSLLINLGIVQRKRGALTEARRQNLAALRLNPKSAIAHNNLGALSVEEKNWDEAIKMFQESLKDDAQWVDAYLNLGSVYEKKAEWANAKQAYVAYLAHPAADPAVKILLKKRIPKLVALIRLLPEKVSP